MTSKLVRQLIAANEGDESARAGDIFYRAAERIDYLENAIEDIADAIDYPGRWNPAEYPTMMDALKKIGSNLNDYMNK